jgi:hypothetical protein
MLCRRETTGKYTIKIVIQHAHSWNKDRNIMFVLMYHHHKLLDLMTDSSWVSIRFQSRVFRFYFADGTSNRHYIAKCWGVHATNKMGSSLDDWIY